MSQLQSQVMEVEPVTVEQLTEFPQTLKNDVTEKKLRSPCEALPAGWTKEIVLRRSGQSAGKSDVYYYSPMGKKVRSKPELAQHILQSSGETVDLTNFDFRSGAFVDDSSKKAPKKRKQPSSTDVYSKDLNGYSMVLPSTPVRQSKKILIEPVTLIPTSENMSASERPGVSNGIKNYEVVSPRQIFWERRLQSVSHGTKRLEDFDLFSNTNGEFHSFLHSIVKTLQMERDLANKRVPLGTVTCSAKKQHEQPTSLIKITKADITRQEREVIKARKELAKAITEYEAAKSLL